MVLMKCTKFVSIDQSLAEIQPLNQFWVNLVTFTTSKLFFFTSRSKNSVQFILCAAQSKDHLSQFWEELSNLKEE